MAHYIASAAAALSCPQPYSKAQQQYLAEIDQKIESAVGAIEDLKQHRDIYSNHAINAIFQSEAFQTTLDKLQKYRKIAVDFDQNPSNLEEDVDHKIAQFYIHYQNAQQLLAQLQQVPDKLRRMLDLKAEREGLELQLLELDNKIEARFKLQLSKEATLIKAQQQAGELNLLVARSKDALSPQALRSGQRSFP
jgi:hypothetical protein